jgi:hypothetical protein
VQELFHQLLENAFGGFANFSLNYDETKGQKAKMLVLKCASCERVEMKKKAQKQMRFQECTKLWKKVKCAYFHHFPHIFFL